MNDNPSLSLQKASVYILEEIRFIRLIGVLSHALEHFTNTTTASVMVAGHGGC